MWLKSISMKSIEKHVSQLIPIRIPQKNQRISGLYNPEMHKVKWIWHSQEFLIVLCHDVQKQWEELIPPKVESIGQGAFYECCNLEKVIFSQNSKNKIIDEYAFTYFELKSISIPPSVASIKNASFSDCLIKLNWNTWKFIFNRIRYLECFFFFSSYSKWWCFLILLIKKNI